MDFIWHPYDQEKRGKEQGLEDHNYYLVTHKQYATPMKAKWHNEGLWEVYVGKGDNEYWWDWERDNPIIAWMVLPTIYKKEEIKMEDEKQVYIAELLTYYCCGEYSNSGSSIIGVFSTISKAEEAGQDALLEDFAYDAETGVFYNRDTDEAWVNITKYSIDTCKRTFIKHLPAKRG